MAAMILNSSRAIEMSVYVVRAFVWLRETLTSNKELSKRLYELEAQVVRNAPSLALPPAAGGGELATRRYFQSPPPVAGRSPPNGQPLKAE
jgi:hypothetical protein